MLVARISTWRTSWTSSLACPLKTRKRPRHPRPGCSTCPLTSSGSFWTNSTPLTSYVAPSLESQQLVGALKCILQWVGVTHPLSAVGHDLRCSLLVTEEVADAEGIVASENFRACMRGRGTCALCQKGPSPQAHHALPFFAWQMRFGQVCRLARDIVVGSSRHEAYVEVSKHCGPLDLSREGEGELGLADVSQPPEKVRRSVGALHEPRAALLCQRIRRLQGTASPTSFSVETCHIQASL